VTLGGDRVHKPGVLFPYVDNDIGSYAHLDEYLALVHDLFGGKVRITTVGFSSRNDHLVNMHTRIATEMANTIAGIRLSVTPFTIGWSAVDARNPVTSRQQFWNDLGTVLSLYRPLLDTIGAGKEAFSVELRFRPLVERVPVVDRIVLGRHVVAAGPHLLLSLSGDVRPETSRIVGLRNNVPGRRDQTMAPEPVFSATGRPYLHVISDKAAAAGVDGYVRQALAGDLPSGAMVRQVTVHLMEHQDGPYFATDPIFTPSGTVRSLMVYPGTDSRVSGYNDASRFFLNALLQHKRNRGRDRRAEFPDASARDVAAVILRLRRDATELDRCDERAANYVRNEIIPLISGYGSAVLSSGLSPSLFFSRGFTIDTGQSVNQGRGHVLFKGLVSKPDIPATPWEERGYLISHSKGYVWRIAPVPYAAGKNRDPGIAQRGHKNDLSEEPSIAFEEIDPRHVKPYDFETGRPLRRYRISGVGLEHLTLADAQRQYLYPGLRKEPTE
jgi:hypothetical protein